MKKFNKALAIILSISMTMSFVPSNLSLAMDESATEIIEGETNNTATEEEIASIEEFVVTENMLNAKPSEIKIIESPNKIQIEDEGNRFYDEIPTAYSLRDLGKVSSVKNQYPYGTCWAFAAISAAESNLLMDGETEINLSEYQLVYFTYNHFLDPLGGTVGDTCVVKASEYNSTGSILENGGNSDLVNITWAMGAGITSEDKMKYSEALDTATFTSEYAYNYNVAQLRDCYWIKGSDMESIKRMIMTYGGGVTSIGYAATYYNSTTHAFYNSVSSSLNHDITVVGWDDDYSKTNFKTQPTKNGAWLCKNSWGTSWGDGGYFWVSYESLDALATQLYFYDVSTDKYDNNYCYDGGVSNSYSYSNFKNISMANIFTATSNQKLKAVSFFTIEESDKYQVQIYKNLINNEDPTNGTLVYTSEMENLPYAGYHTIEIPEDIILSKDEMYSVVVYIENVSDEVNVFALVEKNNTENCSWYSSKASAVRGQSYVSRDQINWSDTAFMGDGNVRVKAFTDEIKSVTGVTLNKTTATITKGGTDTLIPTISPSDADNKTVAFSSSNNDVATVTNEGVVTGVGAGTANITVTTADGSKTAACAITVSPVKVTGVTLNKTTATVITGNTINLVATVVPSNADNKAVVFTSSNNAVAAVNNQGVVTGVGAGTANITVTTADGSKTAVCTVTVENVLVTNITASIPSNAILLPKNSFQLEVSVSPSNATNNNVLYTSSNTSVATVSSTGVVTIVGVGSTLIDVIAADGSGKSSQVALTSVNPNVSVTYRTHVQNVGWQGYVSDGITSGTVGRSLRLEGINISTSGNSDLGITYSTHVQNIGWQDYVSNGDMSGTSGRSLRLEAIKIKLTGTAAQYYDVYYRVHAQDYGWLDWAKNGEAAGTEGYSKRLEGIQIKIVLKGTGNLVTTRPFVSAYGLGNINYQTHVQNVGWQSYVKDGITSGTSGRSLRLEGIRIRLGANMPSGSINYQTHVQNIGWQSTVSNGTMSGTSGRYLRLEAIKISLSGEVAQSYDVYYRVHAQDYGWLDWAMNGEMAGTSGCSKRLEAIQIVLVPKGGNAPGSTARPAVIK